MRKLTAIWLLLLTAMTAGAVDFETLRQKGLPADAMPASFFFEYRFNGTRPAFTEQDINNSSCFGVDDSYYFFVQPITGQPEEDFERIAVWMYTENTDRVVKVFSQQNDEYSELFVSGMGWLLDKRYSFKNHVNEDTHETIRLQEYSFSPVIVLQAEVFTGFSHSPRVTLIINPVKKTTKRIDGEQFVSIFHTKTNMLMSAEQDLAQDYILTTSTGVRTEEMPLKESSDYTIYNKQFLTPVLHVYTADGQLVKSVELPQDEVDMVR